MLAIVDYGVGNLFSLTQALKSIGAQSTITDSPDDIKNAGHVILPGVGAFGDAAIKLRQAAGMVEALDEHVRLEKPLLGICVGMQLLYEKGYEFGEYDGLGYLKGGIYALSEDISLKVPHMGWNKLDIKRQGDPLLNNIKQGDYAYFVHSFYAKNCDDSTVATCEYGVDIPAIVHRGAVSGTQFHPEKSGETGMNLLRAFLSL